MTAQPDTRPGLTLMLDYGVDLPVWHGPGGNGVGGVDAEELMSLGVSRPLIERLRAWEEGWDHDPFRGSPPKKVWPGQPLSVRLARQLQAELPGYRIHLATGSGFRPVDEWPR